MGIKKIPVEIVNNFICRNSLRNYIIRIKRRNISNDNSVITCEISKIPNIW